MNNASADKFCTIERTPGRIRLRIRHEPAQLPGALTPPREGARALRGFAREVAFRLNEARSAPARQKPHTSAYAAPRGSAKWIDSSARLLSRTIFLITGSI